MKQLFIHISTLILIFLLCSCSQSDAKITSEKKTGINQDGIHYVELEIKNVGGQPAYFVIVMVQVIKDGIEIDYAEREIGDIFPDSKKNVTFLFPNLKQTPDDYKIEITYSQYGNKPV